MSMTAKTALLNTFKNATNSTQKVLQKSWEIATWGNNSSHDYAKTMKYKTASFITAAPVSFLSAGKMISKLTHDCPLLSSCPPLPPPVETIIPYAHPVTALLGTGVVIATATTAYLAAQAFNRATGDFISSCGKTVNSIVEDSLSEAIHLPINPQHQAQLEQLIVQRQDDVPVIKKTVRELPPLARGDSFSVLIEEAEARRAQRGQEQLEESTPQTPEKELPSKAPSKKATDNVASTQKHMSPAQALNHKKRSKLLHFDLFLGKGNSLFYLSGVEAQSLLYCSQ